MTTKDTSMRRSRARDALIAEALAFFRQMSKDFTRFGGVALDDPEAADWARMHFLRKAEVYAVGAEALEYLQAAREET